MKHTIRRNGQLVQIDCELGSGRRDMHGKEICEGDIVVFDGDADRYLISFHDAAFFVDDFPLLNFIDDDLEVVGHISEGTL